MPQAKVASFQKLETTGSKLATDLKYPQTAQGIYMLQCVKGVNVIENKDMCRFRSKPNQNLGK